MNAFAPPWFVTAIGPENENYSLQDGVWVAKALRLSRQQGQTGDIFDHKWRKEDTYTSPTVASQVKKWADERYGDFGALLKAWPDRKPVVLDAGCGAAMTALEFLGPFFDKIHYIGVDVSKAVFTARKRVTERGLEGVFMQDNVAALPFKPQCVDMIFSEGVLHHTDSTKNALTALSSLLKPQGYFLFYVYNKKGPIREFCDDYIRDALQKMGPAEAWEALRPLTELGRQLGEIDATLNLPDGIPLLNVPPGEISLHRFIYWHVFKAFYNPEMNFEEMLHVNFDWYAPANAHRQTPDEVRAWCAELGLSIERLTVENAGITVVARKEASAPA